MAKIIFTDIPNGDLDMPPQGIVARSASSQKKSLHGRPRGLSLIRSAGLYCRYPGWCLPSAGLLFGERRPAGSGQKSIREDMMAWYKELFEDYAKQYDTEDFVQHTESEVAFIEEVLAHDTSIRILDIGCGTGRHSIELAARGYPVTGVDLSKAQLKRARGKAALRNVSVSFEEGDARRLPFENCFGCALSLCEGGFPLMETDEENFEILKSAARALVPGGILILTTLNGLFPMAHSIKALINDTSTTSLRVEESSFDLMTFREAETFTVTQDSGRELTITSSERFYVPPELRWLLVTAGFADVELYGCMPGQYNRERKPNPDDFEMMAIARKAVL